MAEETNSATPAEPEQIAVTHSIKPTMDVKVYAPFKIYYEGTAFSISALNATGPFDILPHHHKFLCMLVPCTLTIQTPNGPQSIKVNRALMHVQADRVVVFMDV